MVGNDIEGYEKDSMTLKEFVETWYELKRSKNIYGEFFDYNTIICSNGIVIRADNYTIDRVFSEEYISFYRKGEKMAVVKLKYIKFIY
jgi:hypothetical protein